jgi:chromosome segregation ATPase
MSPAILLLIALAQSVVVGFLLFRRAVSAGSEHKAEHAAVKDELAQKRALWAKIESLQQELADPAEYEVVEREFAIIRDALKAERGRVIITQAELESVEVRLRELDEVTRELEASTLETKEELKILQKKEGELKTKNQELRVQIADSTSKMEMLMSEIEMSVQLEEQVKNMRADLLKCEEQVETLMNEIQKGNEQYFIAKRRYDALDVEYAQLYQQYIEQKQK